MEMKITAFNNNDDDVDVWCNKQLRLNLLSQRWLVGSMRLKERERKMINMLRGKQREREKRFCCVLLCDERERENVRRREPKKEMKRGKKPKRERERERER